MGEDLRGGTGLVADVEGAKVVRGAAQGFAAPVGDGSDRVAQELAGGIGRCGHGLIPFFADKSDKEEFKRREAEGAEEN
jgi:hypothetical protein